jgi:HAD superfamily hydrolase (TIGR01490 family)
MRESVEGVFFDLDKTVIARASMLALGTRFFQEGLITRRTVARSLYAQTVYKYLGANERRLKRLENAVLNLTQGWEQSMVLRVVTEALGEIITPLIYREAMDLIDLHHLAGRKVFLVSASPEEVVGPMASFLGVDGYIGSRSRVDEDGKYTGELMFYAYGPYKVEAIVTLAADEGIDLSNSYAYSDSYTDVPMLEMVGHPIAVNPDRVLTKVAKERGWEILEFSQTTKVSRPYLVRTLRNAALLVAVLAGGSAPFVGRSLLRRRRDHQPS